MHWVWNIFKLNIFMKYFPPFRPDLCLTEEMVWVTEGSLEADIVFIDHVLGIIIVLLVELIILIQLVVLLLTGEPVREDIPGSLLVFTISKPGPVQSWSTVARVVVLPAVGRLVVSPAYTKAGVDPAHCPAHRYPGFALYNRSFPCMEVWPILMP